MNEKDAIDLASIHGITVTTDSVKRISAFGRWHSVVSFKVGNFHVTRNSDKSRWTIVGVGSETFRRGEAIEKCVRLILESQQTA